MTTALPRRRDRLCPPSAQGEWKRPRLSGVHIVQGALKRGWESGNRTGGVTGQRADCTAVESNDLRRQ